jgi:hypothetical protein
MVSKMPKEKTKFKLWYEKKNNKITGYHGVNEWSIVIVIVWWCGVMCSCPVLVFIVGWCGASVSGVCRVPWCCE